MSDTLFLTLVIGGIFYITEGVIVGILTYKLWRIIYNRSKKREVSVFLMPSSVDFFGG